MFTEADYINYFDQLARIERKMIYRSYDLGREVIAPFVTRVLQKIGDDEVRHYGYVLKMIRDIEDPGPLEKRRESREYCLGTIRLRSLQDPQAKEIKAYCVNLSKSGVCLESEQGYSLGGNWELTIRLFGKEEAIHYRGQSVWSKEVEPGFYISGIEFTG